MNKSFFIRIYHIKVYKINIRISKRDIIKMITIKNQKENKIYKKDISITRAKTVKNINMDKIINNKFIENISKSSTRRSSRGARLAKNSTSRTRRSSARRPTAGRQCTSTRCTSIRIFHESILENIQEDIIDNIIMHSIIWVG